MAEKDAVVGIYNSHTEAEASIKELQRSGFDMKKLSIVGKDYHTEEHVIERRSSRAMGRPIRTTTTWRSEPMRIGIPQIHVTGDTPMPQTPHIEQHFTGSKIVRDIVIGMSDGLTVDSASHFVRAGPARADMGSLVTSVYQRPLEARHLDSFGKGKEIAKRRFMELTAGKLKMSKPAWYQAIGKYAHSDPSKSLWQLLDTFVPYCVLWALMRYTVRQGYPYWVTLAFAVVAGGILVRIFILFHDCCHGSFFASRRANTILGYVAGILTFTPYEDWRYAHNIHHATQGDIDRQGVGDIWTMRKGEYLAAPRRSRLAYRIYRNPFVLFGPGPALLFLFFQRFSSKGAGKKERRSVLFTNLALLAIIALASSTIGFQTYLLIQLPIILIASTFGLWLFYVQHQFESVYWARHEFWDHRRVALEGSSYFKLPKILQWFSGNIGLHHVHHARPTIPNYNLQQCCDDIPAFQPVVPLTIRTSLKSLRLSLYDEEQKKLIGFRSLKASASR